MFKGNAPYIFRPARYEANSKDPINELWLWIVTYEDGHEAILMSIGNVSTAPAQHPDSPMSKRHDFIWNALKENENKRRKRDPSDTAQSLRLAHLKEVGFG